MRDVERIEILDRQLSSREDRFLRLETLRLRNHYADGTSSREYACDVVLAPGLDAVAVVLFHRQGREVFAGVTECVRPAIYLRRDLPLLRSDGRDYLTLTETVAGRLEKDDVGEEGIDRRAAIEAHEEAGFEVGAGRAIRLGGGLFASPGVTPEKVYFRAFEVDPARQQEVRGDGSPMEASHRMRFIELGEAIGLCARGVIEDPKAEVGFRRLADHLKGTCSVFQRDTACRRLNDE